jgi:hypothetical protein
MAMTTAGEVDHKPDGQFFTFNVISVGWQTQFLLPIPSLYVTVT